MASAALYIHVPFCEKRCNFCDFYTVAGIENRIPDYLQALQHEITLRATEPFWQNQRFGTIYFGGGTPSLLQPEQISDIMASCNHHFQILDDAEITIEIDPATVDAIRLAEYCALGINRMSIGVQSFWDDDLAMLDRAHTAQQARATAVAARKAGITNLSLDFIFALPGQNLQRWQYNLEQAQALQPEHISSYNLTLHPGTPLYRAVQNGKAHPLNDEEERRLFEFTIDFLDRHGFRHYEISNFCRAGYHSRHNTKYWDGSFYLGLGASAHSFDGHRRFWNVANLRRYLRSLVAGKIAHEDEEVLSPPTRMFEFAFLGLRRQEGIDLMQFEKIFRVKFEHAFNGKVTLLQEAGLVESDGGHLRLTREGVFLADAVCAQLEPDISSTDSF